METCTSSDLLYNIHPQRKHQMFSEIISKKVLVDLQKISCKAQKQVIRKHIQCLYKNMLIFPRIQAMSMKCLSTALYR